MKDIPTEPLILNSIWTGPGDEYYQQAYGKEVLVTRLGRITIVHPDHPDEVTIQKRIEEVMREEIDGSSFEDDCPLCQDFKQGSYDVVYTTPFEG